MDKTKYAALTPEQKAEMSSKNKERYAALKADPARYEEYKAMMREYMRMWYRSDAGRKHYQSESRKANNRKQGKSPKGRANRRRKKKLQTIRKRCAAALLGCSVCGINDPLVLPISTNGRPIMCRNCRAKQRPDNLAENAKLSGDKGRSARRRLRFANIKSERGCVHCAERDHRALEFHHRDPETKASTVSGLLNSSIKAALEEVAKCDVVCKNCHTRQHSLEYVSETQPESQSTPGLLFGDPAFVKATMAVLGNSAARGGDRSHGKPGGSLRI